MDDLLEKLSVVVELSRRRTVLWRAPSMDGPFWDTSKFRSLPRGTTRREALDYLQHPARAHWRAELWDRTLAWWTPVADLV